MSLADTLTRYGAEQIADAGRPAFITMTFQIDCNGGAVTCGQWRKEDGTPFVSLNDGPVISEYFDYTENEEEPLHTMTFATLREALEDTVDEAITDDVEG